MQKPYNKPTFSNTLLPRKDNIMKKFSWFIFFLLLGRGFGAELFLPPLSPKIHSKLSEKLTQNPDERITVWIFFTDKGIRTEGEYLKALQTLQVLPYQGDWTDLPLHEDYIRKIEKSGGSLRVRSEWLNGASFTLQKRMVSQVENFPFVREIREVARTRKEIEAPERKKEKVKMRTEGKVEKETDPSLLAFEESDYGESYDQVAMLKIPEAHRMGFVGEGVTIGILDTGFELDITDFDNIHNSIRHLRKHNRIMGEHDFNTGDALFFRSSSNQGGIWTPEGSPPNTFSALIAHHDLGSDSGEIHWVFDGDISLNDPSPDPNRADIFHLVSYDGGMNWSQNTLTSGTTGFSTSPRLDVGDTTFIVWQNDSTGVPEIYLSFPPINSNRIRVSVPPFDGIPSRSPDVARSDGYYHVVWTDGDASIIHKRSSNPAIWTGSVDTLALSSIGELVNPRIAVDSSFVHVVWELSGFLPSNASAVFYRRSTDGGGSWPGDTVRLAPDGRSPILTMDGNGILHLVYKDQSQFPDINIGYMRSTNQGVSWTSMDSVLSAPEPYIDGISMAIVDTMVLVSYKKGSAIFVSSFNGTLWTSPYTLSSSIWDKNPLLASDGNNLVATWTRRGDSDVSFDPLSWDSLNYNPYGGSSDAHGTWMLSIAAGLSQGNLIGPAFGSDFLLAKTERAGYENPVEEDWWVDGLEWVTSQGAEIVSSSIAYTTWGTGDWYDWSDMNGRTSITSRVASLALQKGVLVVNAMSNITRSEVGLNYNPDSSCAAPADAFDILAVGGVDSLGQWVDTSKSYYSAKGPTFDGRIKPELAAPFLQLMADLVDNNSYVNRFGTSGATALVAGLAAVVKSAHPSWDAITLRDVLMNTASQGSSPDDTIGYGIPDAVKAIGTPEVPSYEKDQLLDPYPNPFQPAVHDTCVLPYRLLDNALSFPVMRIYTLTGELVKEIELNEKIPGRYFTSWDGRNVTDEEVAGGLYICVLTTGSQTDRKKIAVIR